VLVCAALVSAAVLTAGLAAGCGRKAINVPPVTADRPPAPRKPQPADLTTPQNAIRSYLAYLTYAYILATSDVASQTMGPDELVRIDSYIELDRQRGQKLDQVLKSISFGTPVTESSGKQLVPAQEQWSYRYVDIATGTYKTPGKNASFAATYTVERGPKGWQVTSVEATTTAPVQ
jgi:hypothetical protein